MTHPHEHPNVLAVLAYAQSHRDKAHSVGAKETVRVIDSLLKIVADDGEFISQDKQMLSDYVEQVALMNERELAIRMLHREEQFHDCEEDGDPYPCKTVRVLDWRPTDAGATEAGS